jgi:hypothetical protein
MAWLNLGFAVVSDEALTVLLAYRQKSGVSPQRLRSTAGGPAMKKPVGSLKMGLSARSPSFLKGLVQDSSVPSWQER